MNTGGVTQRHQSRARRERGARRVQNMDTGECPVGKPCEIQDLGAVVQVLRPRGREFCRYVVVQRFCPLN